MSLVTNRRKFLQASAAASLSYWVAGGIKAAESRSPNERIQLGCIGVGGKGKSDVQNASKFGKIYALCDVDSVTLDGMARIYIYTNNKDAAVEVGRLIAERAVAAGVKEVVFDRGPYLFHGRVKALADAAREGGLSF